MNNDETRVLNPQNTQEMQASQPQAEDANAQETAKKKGGNWKQRAAMVGGAVAGTAAGVAGAEIIGSMTEDPAEAAEPAQAEPAAKPAASATEHTEAAAPVEPKEEPAEAPAAKSTDETKPEDPTQPDDAKANDDGTPTPDNTPDNNETITGTTGDSDMKVLGVEHGDLQGTPYTAYQVEQEGVHGTLVDIGDDGKIDIVGVDSTGDGKMDTLYGDSTGDGTFDTVMHDSNADGNYDMMAQDKNHDGQFTDDEVLVASEDVPDDSGDVYATSDEPEPMPEPEPVITDDVEPDMGMVEM